MVKHIILWKLKEEYSAEEKVEIARNIQIRLQGLLGKIDGLTEIKVRFENLPSSTADVMLDSTFVSAEALKKYSAHPEHVAVANAFVRPFTAVRSCFDYEV